MHKRYIVDASVAVKWLNATDEQSLEQALGCLRGAVEKKYELLVPDLMLCEVSNAIVRGKGLKDRALERALDVFFSLPLVYLRTTHMMIATASLLASEHFLSVYDAVYCAVALEQHAPLITGNIKHQGRVKGLAVIDIKDWQDWTE